LSHPACFGSPVAVSHLCETCRSCRGSSACLTQAIEFLETLPNSPLTQRERQRIALSRQALASSPAGANSTGVGTSKRVSLNAEQEGVIAGLGKAVASMAKQLFERGWYEFAHRELKAGRNPGRNDWQRILSAGLIQGGISRDALQLAYQKQLNLTPGSARVRVSKAVSVFLAGRLITEVSGVLVISPN
jgi:hypothetical protein